MPPLTVLVAQARAHRDPMLEQERRCIRKRLSGSPVQIVFRNAVSTPAEPNWLERVDLLVIGGSGDFSVHHPFSRPWVDPLRRLVEQALTLDVPGFGICFGHQLVGTHLGGTVATYPELEEVGTVRLRLTEEGRRCDLFSPLGDVFPVHTGHTDHVTAVPEGADLLVTGDVVDTQAFRVRGSRFYTTQFHPDLRGAEARERWLSNMRDETGQVTEFQRQRVKAFVLGADITATLLGRFVDLVANSW